MTQLKLKNQRDSSQGVLETIGLGLVGFVAGYATGKVLGINPYASGAVGSFVGGVAGASGYDSHSRIFR